MFLSKPAIKPAPLSSESFDVIDAKRSTTWAWVSASSAAAAATMRTKLRAITGIDFDVFLRKIAGPEAGLAFAAPLDGKANLAIALVELPFEFAFNELGGKAAAADRNTLHVDIDAARIELGSGIACRGEDSSPVGIGAGNRRFHQGRVGDGASDALGVVVIACAPDVDVDEFPGALAIAHDLAGETFHDAAQCIVHQLAIALVGSEPGCAVRQQQHHVVSRGIAVDTDAVITVFDRVGKHGAQLDWTDVGVHHHETECGGHVGLDHAGALGHAGDAHKAMIELDDGGGRFRDDVGGHDGACDVFEAIVGKAADELWDGVDDQVRVELDADDAGGCGQDLFDRSVQLFGHGFGGDSGDGFPGSSGAVSIAGVDQNGSDEAARLLEMILRNDDRRGLDAILRKDGRGPGGAVRDDETEIVPFELANACVGGRVLVAEGEVHRRSCPKISLSDSRTPLRKSDAEMRLRPSCWTSSSSSDVPAPHETWR